MVHNFLNMSDHFFGGGRDSEVVKNWNEVTQKYANIFNQNHCFNVLRLIKNDSKLKSFFDEKEKEHDKKIYITKPQQYALIEWFLAWADDEDIKALTKIIQKEIK